MSEALELDRAALRLSFERSAARYDAAAVLQNEVCNRMLSRLEYIRHEPHAILDAGSGTGNAHAGLHARYPQARLYALDFAVAMLRESLRRVAWWRRFAPRSFPVCADMQALPIRSATVDMIWSNLALQWSTEPKLAFAEFRRVLAPNGLLMFSTFGPDTLKELRAAYEGADGYTHVNRFLDMHDLGDMLVHSGFGDPVMDMEIITLTYEDVLKLMRDLKSIGAHNMTVGRRRGMTGRAVLDSVKAHYEPLRRDGRLPATFEVVYGHAWAPAASARPRGQQVVKWHRR
jgi:malonyl-CoA O-methyltransferase